MSETEITRAAVEGGNALQRVQTGYVTAVAVQRPRRLVDVHRRLNDEARLGGENFYYGWGAGKDQIEGPSIQLATAAARSWGNCAVELEQVQDLGDSWVFTAVFVDVETGFTLKRQFRQSKTSKVYGKHDEERKTDIRFQIGQSKATRNVILNSLPKSLIREALDTAKHGVRERLEAWIEKRGSTGLVDAQTAALEQLKRVGVAEERVLAKLGRSAPGGLTIDDLILLKGDIMAINDGTDRAEELYPTDAAPEGGSEGLMQHLGEKDPFPGPDGENAPPPPPNTPAGGSQSDSTPPNGEPPPPTPPGTNEQTKANVEAEVTEADVEKVTSGAFGPVSQESATELRARYNRLGEDPEALAKYEVDYGALIEIDGSDAEKAMKRIESYYRGLAEKRVEK